VFEVFEALPAGPDVIGQVQHMITLMIRQRHLQERETVIQIFDQTDPLGQQMNGAQAAAGHGFGAPGHLIVHIAGAKHGSRLVLPIARSQPVRDWALAVAEDLRVISLHSKCLVRGLG